MIRIAFLLNVSENWLGGLNYYKSLISAIVENRDLGLEPVIIIPAGFDKSLLSEYPKIEIIESRILSRYSMQWIIRKIICKSGEIDPILVNLLKKHKIDVVSHLQDNLFKMNIPTIGWIPDFQHKYLPDLFTQAELQARDKNFNKISASRDTVIVSSYDAKKDFLNYFPQYQEKVDVLQFVVSSSQALDKDIASYLEDQYQLQGKFFYLPNQFWIHKNHKIVLEALSILQKQHKKVLVVATGNINDYRNKEYYATLLEYIHINKLEEYFRSLGKVPYQDVQGLSKNCLAFINPSLFEGWSTTVEEAKSMGKKIILSDIAVHREQDPEGGEFFDPRNAGQLADLMWKVWNCNEKGETLQENAKNTIDFRRREFAQCYKSIVLNTVKRFTEQNV